MTAEKMWLRRGGGGFRRFLIEEVGRDTVRSRLKVMLKVVSDLQVRRTVIVGSAPHRSLVGTGCYRSPTHSLMTESLQTVTDSLLTDSFMTDSLW